MKKKRANSSVHSNWTYKKLVIELSGVIYMGIMEKLGFHH